MSDMKERILQEAARLFTERGYHGVSMRELADACEVTQAAFYYHFRNKEAILATILKTYLEEIGAAIDAIRSSGGSASAQLTQIVQALFNQRPDQQAVIRLAMQENNNLDQDTRRQFFQLYHQRFTGQIEAVLQSGVEQGEFRPLPAATYTWILLGMVSPFLMSSIQVGEMPQDAPAKTRLIMEALFRGIAHNIPNEAAEAAVGNT
jgi:AcrR family transcriptional regulator